MSRFLTVGAAQMGPIQRSHTRRDVVERIVAAKLGPGLGEAGAHFEIERVQSLGAVHPHYQDVPVTLGFDDGHVFLSQTCARRLSDPTILRRGR